MGRLEYLEKKWKLYPAMPKATLASGRLRQIRSHGDSLVLSLSKNNQTIELSVPQGQELATIIQPGDLLAVSEKHEIILLAPAQAALPARQLNLPLLQLWNLYLAKVRQFFTQQGFSEVKTPTLVVCPGTEPTLEVFSTELITGSRRQKMYLPTSPELHLKKTLALGAEKIFEITPCYRNGEVTTHHQPEFYMIEWYRAYDDLESIRGDVEGLIRFLVSEFQNMSGAKSVVGPTRFGRKTLQELFREHCDFDLQPTTTVDELKKLSAKFKMDTHSAESIDDYFFLLFLEKIESQFAKDQLLFVEKYPPYQAALARLTDDGWGDRFEVYWQGLELANAFHELNDPQIQRERFAQDLLKKELSGREALPLDQEFLQCLEAGMPPSAGIALGLERLFMAIFQINEISELKTFPYKNS